MPGLGLFHFGGKTICFGGKANEERFRNGNVSDEKTIKYFLLAVTERSRHSCSN